MANEQAGKKGTPDKKAKASSGNKFLNGLVAIPKRMWSAIQNTLAELKKVTWPEPKALRSYTTIVLVFMTLMAVIVGGLDFVATQLIRLVITR